MATTKEKDPFDHLTGIARESGLIASLNAKVSALNKGILDEDAPRWGSVRVLVDRYTDPVLYVTARQSSLKQAGEDAPFTTSSVVCQIKMDGTILVKGEEEIYQGKFDKGSPMDFVPLFEQAFANPHVQPDHYSV